MKYRHLDFKPLRTFCTQVFRGYGFTEEEAAEIMDALLAAAISIRDDCPVQKIDVSKLVERVRKEGSFV